MIGKASFMRAGELVKKIEPFLLFFGSKPILVSDEFDQLHRIDSIVEVMSNDDSSGRMLQGADYLLMKLRSIRVVKESEKERAFEQNGESLSEYQDVIRKAVGCSRGDAIRFLDEINTQDYVLMSMDDCRRIQSRMEKLESDISILKEKRGE